MPLGLTQDNHSDIPQEDGKKNNGTSVTLLRRERDIQFTFYKKNYLMTDDKSRKIC
jgi:hypothetical protein